MKTKILCSIATIAVALLITATQGYSFGSLGSDVNTICSPATPYTSCSLCHLSDRSAPTDAKTAYQAGGTTLTSFFCPAPPPLCTDNDNDSFAAEGGDCGPIDCDDTDPAINPDATENCSDAIDNNCNGLIDELDPAAVGCSFCTDNDNDGFAFEGGTCGPIDCDDLNPAVNPSAIELCTDGIDNDCNGLVDTQDTNAIDCPETCFDYDGDSYSVDGGSCGPIDCNDNDAGINPGLPEICADAIDNDCDGSVDEGCDAACPDVDGDGYQDATCGGSDCNDNDTAINPEAAEIPGNGIDENCNGSSDDIVLGNCPDGSPLAIVEVEYNRGDGTLHLKVRAVVGTTLTVIDSDTGALLADGILVKEGKWEAEMKDIGHKVERITVISSNGCSVEQKVGTSKDDKDDDYDDDDDDREYKKDRDYKHDRSERRRNRSWKFKPF